MRSLTRRWNLAAASLAAALVGCGGSAATAPSGSVGGGGNAGSSGGGSASAGAATSAGNGGVAGHAAGASSAGAVNHAGAAGAAGGCIEPTTPPEGCQACNCIAGQMVCTDVACPKICGARAGATCSANEYCAYVPGEWCGAADASSTCETRPDACDFIYAPVCGCDQKTYANDCDAAAHGQGVFALGECKQ